MQRPLHILKYVNVYGLKYAGCGNWGQGKMYLDLKHPFV